MGLAPLSAFPPVVSEVFVINEGQNALQLTNFGRVDTWYPIVDVDRKDVYFAASADPLGTNPKGGQIFAVQPDGTGLRQLTASRGLVREAAGVYLGELPGPWAYGPYEP